MLVFLQLIISAVAIYSAFRLEDETRLLVPLACLVLMFIVARADKGQNERKSARKTFLQSEIDKVWQKESTTIVDQNFFTIESLLWPKSELLLVDAVHSIFKDLGFKISTTMNSRSVDRVVKIPQTEKAFGVEVMMSEGEAEKSHPKMAKALHFEKEKREGEKTLIIWSTHTHLPLGERGRMSHVSKELSDFLAQNGMAFITAHHLYELWQKAKRGEIDIFEFFHKIHSHPGSVSPLKGMDYHFSPSPNSYPHS